MELRQSIEEFNGLLSRLSGNNLLGFLGWLKNNISDLVDKARDVSGNENEVILDSIREDIRQVLPQNALSPTETILTPTVGKNSDCDPSTTVHVDAFLYDEEKIDELTDEGKMSRNYCRQCGSHDVKPLTFITHSASVPQVKYMFQYLMPDLRGKTVLDVGSRTGAMLYGGYLFSTSEKIIGVEIDVNFVQLQQRIIEQYNMTDRICIVHNDIMECKDIIENADVIFLNNVFEFFMPKDVQERIWNFLFRSIRKSGTLLVTLPSVEESLMPLQTEVDLSMWLKKLDTSATLHCANFLLYGDEFHEESDLENIFVYEVK